jgi:hypothetical protein
LEGLVGALRYQLTSHTFQSLQQLLDKAIVLESMRRKLGELKRKAAITGPSRSHTCPRFTSPLKALFRLGGPSGGYGQQQQYQHQPQQYQQFQRSPQQFQHSPQQFQRPGPQTPRPAYLQNRPMTLIGTLVRPNVPRTPASNNCYHCGEVGHYTNNCPKSPTPNTPIQNQQTHQMRNGNQTPQSNKGPQSYSRGKVAHVSVETA